VNLPSSRHRGRRITDTFLPRDADNPTTYSTVLIILGIWLIGVIFTLAHHEFWRDEMRALSLVRAADSPWSFLRLLSEEGHPCLWYLLLLLGKSITDSSVVLPVISVLIAAAGVAVFLRRAPFPTWMKCLFIFGALPMYEYSVMARNYGISMLLLFVFAAVYRDRDARPVAPMITLALLAATNAHSSLFVILFSVVWMLDLFTKQHDTAHRREALLRFVPPIIALGGVALSYLSSMPPKHIAATQMYHVQFYQVRHAFKEALLRPDIAFIDLLPEFFPPWAGIIILYVALFGLIRRPALLAVALAAQVSMSMFFTLVYFGQYRHEGLYLMFLLALYWILFESKHIRPPSGPRFLLARIGCFGAMTILLVESVAALQTTALTDIREARSSSKALGEFLNRSPRYREAILIPEPDFFIEALPYYSSNQLYFPRQHSYATFATFTWGPELEMSLHQLTAIAREVKRTSRRPVLVVLGHWYVDRASTGNVYFSIRKQFRWDVSGKNEFHAATRFVRAFTCSITDEDFLVYEVL
jgi:hypothetical protein